MRRGNLTAPDVLARLAIGLAILAGCLAFWALALLGVRAIFIHGCP